MFSKRKLLLTVLFLLVVSSLSLAIPLRVAPVAHASQQQPGGCQNSPDNLVRACISINHLGDIIADAYLNPQVQQSQSYPNCEIWIQLGDDNRLASPLWSISPILCADTTCFVSTVVHYCGPFYPMSDPGSPSASGDTWFADVWLTYGNSPCVFDPYGNPPYGLDFYGDCTPYSPALSPPLAT